MNVGKRAAVSFSVVVDGGAVSGEDDEPGFLKLADDAVVAGAVAPKSELTVAEHFATEGGIFRAGDAPVHKIEDFSLDLWIEFLKVLPGAFVVLNRPSRAAPEPGRRCSVCRDFQGGLRQGSGLRGLGDSPR